MFKVNSERGASSAEYATMLAIICLGTISSMQAVGAQLNDTLDLRFAAGEMSHAMLSNPIDPSNPAPESLALSGGTESTITELETASTGAQEDSDDDDGGVKGDGQQGPNSSGRR